MIGKERLGKNEINNTLLYSGLSLRLNPFYL